MVKTEVKKHTKMEGHFIIHGLYKLTHFLILSFLFCVCHLEFLTSYLYVKLLSYPKTYTVHTFVKKHPMIIHIV
jgi:hypothetical protein